VQQARHVHAAIDRPEHCQVVAAIGVVGVCASAQQRTRALVPAPAQTQVRVSLRMRFVEGPLAA